MTSGKNRPLPEEYLLIKAAERLNEPASQLAGTPLDNEYTRSYWTTWALIAMQADAEIDEKRRKQQERQQKRR